LLSANKLSNERFAEFAESFAGQQFAIHDDAAAAEKFRPFPNRAPILIAQRNLKQARANFQGEVNDIVLQIVGNYWNVVLARENLTVQRKSLRSREELRPRKKALSLGALPPLIFTVRNRRWRRGEWG